MTKDKKYTAIAENVKCILDYSNDMDSKVDKLMFNWAHNKRTIIEKFGGSLIIEASNIMTIDKPDEDKILEYREFVHDISWIIGSEILKDFLLCQGWTTFYKNRVALSWEKDGVRVNAGMKISRALKLFIKDEEELDSWQTRYSRIIQSVKVSGKLCLSVHPLDFLSISETTHNWRSCHSLNGEFRAGNLSYMQDSSTIVAYLKSEKDCQLSAFPEKLEWNSKKWRMLFYINEDADLIFSSKPYPFDNANLVQSSYEMMQNIFKQDSWPSSYTTIDPDSAEKYISDCDGSVQFNDCLCSMSYNPRFKCANSSIENCKPIVVGSVVSCLTCECGDIEFSADYNCVDCGDYAPCSCCGNHTYLDEAYMLEEEYVCPSCYDDAVVWCDNCGEAHNRENPEMYFNDEREVWICPSCYDVSIEEE